MTITEHEHMNRQECIPIQKSCYHNNPVVLSLSSMMNVDNSTKSMIPKETLFVPILSFDAITTRKPIRLAPRMNYATTSSTTGVYTTGNKANNSSNTNDKNDTNNNNNNNNNHHQHHHSERIMVAETNTKIRPYPSGHCNSNRIPVYESIPDLYSSSCSSSSCNSSSRSSNNRIEDEENTEPNDRFQDCFSTMDVIPERMLLPTLVDDMEHYTLVRRPVLKPRWSHGTTTGTD